MRLSDESHAKVERFFREHRREPGLALPPVFVHGGLVGWLLKKFARLGAITFGRHVFVSPSVISRGTNGRAEMPGWLLVHEAAHVLQYEEKGYARFFRDYLRGYWRGLLASGSWGSKGRTAAYLAIAEELEASAAARAYVTAAGAPGEECRK